MLGKKRSNSLFEPQVKSESFSAPNVPTESSLTEAETIPEPLVSPKSAEPISTLFDETNRMGSRAGNILFASSDNQQELPAVLERVQKYIANNHAELLLAESDVDHEHQMKRYIRKFLQDDRVAVEGYTLDHLVATLYTEMAEFGFLTKYIYGKGIEEININSWQDIKVQYSNGRTEKLEESFDSPEHAVNVVRRMLHTSGTVLDNASPIVTGSLAKNIRIAVMKAPIVDEDVGISASIRIVNPQHMVKSDFVAGGTATEPMLDLLIACLRYDASIAMAGATSSGKTTLTGWLLGTVPYSKRIFTIENGSRELDLVRYDENGVVSNNVIHTITRPSEQDSMMISQESLLDVSLRFHPDIIVVGEMRSAEAYAAQEAARTGHTVLTTIHSNSCESTHHRMMTLCKRAHEMKDETLISLVAEAFPIIVYSKQLEDKSRKIMQIMECITHPDGAREYVSLYRYHIQQSKLVDDEFVVSGEHLFEHNISQSLQHKFLENGMPVTELERLLKGENPCSSD